MSFRFWKSRFFQRPSVRLSIRMSKAWFAWHMFVTHVFEVGPADGPSMLPTFSTYGDWIGTDKRYRLGRGVRVGDLVLYQMPFAAHDMGVKRVIGLPGDYVSMGTPGQKGEENMLQVWLFILKSRGFKGGSIGITADSSTGSRRPLLGYG
ncbi:mitochondrial inner membrane protease subunit 1 [Cordyceps javanica]|uniref:Mitochondrial inner membrane protease subunit 1 n=1 Tax=Cordyceps javanica TaxID=43265 RepID=A0A545UQP7_9HYPO|nr:mitochondrial inner membrane protease subunit 1 [Cordyceps javanica]TQW03739.1 mitochondrial inner membrane protease subunit 1 [Cordyceps javanica]